MIPDNDEGKNRSGIVKCMRIYEKPPDKGVWIGPFSYLCLRIEVEGKPRDMFAPKYAATVFRTIRDTPPRKLEGFCETGYHLVEYLSESTPRSCFSLSNFGRDFVELCCDQIRPDTAKHYISEIIRSIGDEFPDAYVEGRELLN